MKAKSKFSKVEVLARLLTQDINGKNLVVLSEECKASVMDLSQPGESYIYSIYIKNEDQNENSKWSHLSFDLKPDIDLCHFTTKDVDVFQWITKTNIYFLEILVDDLNERNLDNFWKILEHCLCSVVKKIPIDRAQLQCKKGSNKYIKKLGEIKNLDNHVEYMLKLVEERKRKEAVEKELIEGMKELYKQRKETIERLFGTAKEHHGFRYTQMYGKARMEMKVGLTYACLNLKKLAKMLQRIGVIGGPINPFSLGFATA